MERDGGLKGAQTEKREKRKRKEERGMVRDEGRKEGRKLKKIEKWENRKGGKKG